MPKLSQEAIDELVAGQKLQFEDRIETLLGNYRQHYEKWHKLLKEDFNLVLYGFGSKKRLLQDFLQQRLCHEDCVVVSGFFPSLTIKQVLHSIADDILCLANTTMLGVRQILDAMDERRDQHLYLLVNNIDGPMLRNDMAQEVFSQLCSHPCIHMICTIDHINAPLIWDQPKLAKFNFVWYDTTTYLPYREETRYENSFMLNHGGALELSSLVHVYASLSQNAKEIFRIVARHQLDTDGNEDGGDVAYASANDNGIPFPVLNQKCREAFLVSSDVTLRAQMTEYRDHKLITIKKGADGIDYISIPLKHSTLLEFLEIHENY